MSERELVSNVFTPHNRTMWHEDPLTGNVTVVTERDSEPVLDENARIRADIRRGTPHGEMALARRVPLHIWLEWFRLGITEDDEAYRRVLNSSEFSGMRIRPGRV